MSSARSAVIIFGASGGLGRELLAGLVASGEHEIYGTAHTGEGPLASALEEVGLDPSERMFTLDATDFQQVRECVRRVAARQEIWGAVNLVGVPTARRLASASAHEIEQALRANILPAVWVTKALLESHRELERTGGRIVHASSVVARRPVPGTIPYAASKGAVEGLVRASAEEAARYAITINALRLGYFEAGMGADVPERMLESVRAATPQARLGTADDLVNCVGFLLSERSSFITGTTVEIDGGLV